MWTGSHWLRRSTTTGRCPPRSALALAAGLAESLVAIHKAGVVHRDLKPSNVLLAGDGPRVIDFGISRAAESTSMTRAGFVIGSPGCMSPEQARGDDVGPPSDMFSLGAVLAFAATGEPPFGNGSTVALLFRVGFTPPRLDGVPDGIRPPVERCLVKEPSQRPSASELLTEIAALQPMTGWLPKPIASAFPESPAQALPEPPPPPPLHAAAAEEPSTAPPDFGPTVTGQTPFVAAEPGTVPPEPGPVIPERGTGDLQGGGRRSRLSRPLVLGAATAVILVASGATALAVSGSGRSSRSSSTRPTTVVLAASPGTTAQLSPTATGTSHRPSASPTRRPTARATTPAPATTAAAPRPTPTPAAAPADQYSIGGAAIQYSCADLNSLTFPNGAPANLNTTLVNNSPITVQVLYVGGSHRLYSFAQTLQPGVHFLVGTAVGVYLVFENESGRCLAVARVTGSGSVTIT